MYVYKSAWKKMSEFWAVRAERADLDSTEPESSIIGEHKDNVSWPKKRKEKKKRNR